MKNSLFYILYSLIIVGLVVVIIKGHRQTPQTIETIDTVVVTDTFVRPEPVEKLVIRRDTVLVASDSVESDIVVIHDTIDNTVKVEIPITQSVYEDSTYRAVVSGYHASLDSIFIRHNTITIRERVRKSRFGLGVSVGYDPFNNRPAVIIGGHITIINL